VEQLVAFYGTLMSGLPCRPGRPDLAPHVRLVSRCLIPGKLFDLGPYPVLVPGDGVVHGELWRTTSRHALGVLDRWEAYDPADESSSEYLRRPVRLLDPDVTAWVYLWNRPLGSMTRIRDGDWRSHFGAQPPPWVRELLATPDAGQERGE
jgi:gamma-glutamylcyclotransferase (GGCT)/AIG2-like uncharacterized protein YtfP